jgi:hypothetical protein
MHHTAVPSGSTSFPPGVGAGVTHASFALLTFNTSLLSTLPYFPNVWTETADWLLSCVLMYMVNELNGL